MSLCASCGHPASWGHRCGQAVPPRPPDPHIRDLAKTARATAAAPDYDEQAIKDALWAVVDAALVEPAPATALEGAARRLANEAAFAVTEPRRFHENEDHRQQALGHAIAAVRSELRDAPVAPERCPAIGDVGAVQPQVDRGNVATIPTTEDS